jgi:DNA invertase Pin-like site-specific DNA recombinase
LNEYFGYIRVSTTKQGERSVSLPEQKSAIERYAARAGLTLIQWFEEQQTAAKQGRPIWNGMLRELRKGTARGVVIHKIDRSARNLKDWADLGELIDRGIEVHFANESLDLHSRGGRLSADIQAVVASDYIRNLREETKKGIYGRLKQGFYPLRAPIGYLDNGAAKAKTIDREKGPLVRKAFELYGTGQWSIPTLVNELYRRGLRNHAKGPVTRTGLHTILRNPFYTGVMRIRASGETYEGNHEALISKGLFDRVQNILHGRVGTRVRIHDCTFRRFITCAACGNHLIGELQKRRVYYRCHTKACAKTSIREDALEAIVVKNLRALEFSEPEKALMFSRIAELKASWIENKERELQNAKLKIEQVTERLNRLTDVFLEGALDRSMFEERKAMLIAERRAMNDRLADYQANRVSAPDELRKFVELAGSAYSLYRNAATEKKRRLLRIVMSNCIIRQKDIDIAWLIPFRQVANREKETDGAPSKEIGRTSTLLADRLFTFFAEQPETVDFSIMD